MNLISKLKLQAPQQSHSTESSDTRPTTANAETRESDAMSSSSSSAAITANEETEEGINGIDYLNTEDDEDDDQNDPSFEELQWQHEADIVEPGEGASDSWRPPKKNMMTNFKDLNVGLAQTMSKTQSRLSWFKLTERGNSMQKN